MALRVRFQGGSRAGETLEFGDTHVDVRFGRNPATCDVVFTVDETRVSREHFILRRVLSSYRLVTNRETPVYIDGKLGHDDQIVESLSEVQVGQDGPKVLIEIVGAGELPATSGFKERLPSLHQSVERVAEQETRTRTLVHLALGGTLLAAVAAWLGYRVADAGISAAHEGLAMTQERVDAVERAASRETQIAKATFRPVVAELKESVYVVCARFGDGAGGLRPLATAWVAGHGVLATNAHVAEGLEALGPGVPVVVRNAALQGEDVPVDSWEVHPGYELFARLIDESKAFDPLEGRVHSGAEFGACDVALLRVAPEQAPRLGKPLVLATEEELAGLESGEVVGMLGFPMEGLIRGGLSLRSPQPTFQQGTVTGLTDFLLARADSAASELVHVSVQAAGGSSGSPVFLRSGHVVAVFSAGNSFKLGSSAPRIPLGGVNYAQRIDLLRELSEGRASSGLAAREARWRRSMEQLFTDGVGALLIGIERQIASQTQMRLETVASHTGELTEAVQAPTDPGAIGFEFVAQHSGPHAVLAAARRAVDIDLLILAGDQTLAVDTDADYTPTVVFETRAGSSYRILVLTSDAGVGPSTRIDLRVARLVAP